MVRFRCIFRSREERCCIKDLNYFIERSRLCIATSVELKTCKCQSWAQDYKKCKINNIFLLDVETVSENILKVQQVG